MYKIILFILTFNSINVIAQPAIVAQQCWGSKSGEYFNSATLLKDNTFLLSTNTGDTTTTDFKDSPYPKAAVLMKIDTNFNVIWKKYIGGFDGSSGILKTFELKNGNICLLGSTRATTDVGLGNHGGSDFFIAQTDSLGNKLWSKCYGGIGVERYIGAIHTMDNGALIAFDFNNAGGNIPIHYGTPFNSDACILKVDSAGNLEWIKVIGGTENDGPMGNPIQIDSMHYRVDFNSWSKDFDFSNNPIDTNTIYRTIFDNNGNIIKEEFLDGSTDMRYIETSFIDAKGFVTQIGYGNSHSKLYTTYPTHDKWEGCLVKSDSNLKTIFYKQWGGSMNDYFTTFCKDKYGNYYFFGQTGSSNGDVTSTIHGNTDYWILCVDSIMNKKWSRTFGGSWTGEESSSNLNSIFIINHFLYYFGSCYIPSTLPDYDINCGVNHFVNVPYFSTPDAWAVKFDLRKSIDVIKDSNSIGDLKFNIYPNPFTNQITLKKLSSTISNKLKVMLIATDGRLILKRKFEIEDETILEFNELITGHYILQILEGNSIIFSTKVVKQ